MKLLFMQVALCEAVHSRRDGSHNKIAEMPKALVMSDEVQEGISAAEKRSGEKSNE